MPYDTKPGRRTPSSSHLHKSLALYANKSDDDPPYVMEISSILPQTSYTAGQFNPNLFFLPHTNFFCPTQAFAASFAVGFSIQMRIPLIAPAQLSNPTVLADLNPFEIFLAQ
jgi:hypothetical protein